MITIGIVGSPAGGKSIVASILAELGGTWINADLIARDVLQLPEVQAELVEHFGRVITSQGGEIDRGKLADQVFGDDDTSRAALKYLESVIHPRTREIIASQLTGELKNDSACGFVILDIPLLFEAKWDVWCDEIICIDAPEFVRQQRADARGWNTSELGRREKVQLPIAEKRRLSTFVVDNDGNLEQLKTCVTDWLSTLQKLLPQTTLMQTTRLSEPDSHTTPPHC